jgi:hypothetical protein
VAANLLQDSFFITKMAQPLRLIPFLPTESFPKTKRWFYVETLLDSNALSKMLACSTEIQLQLQVTMGQMDARFIMTEIRSSLQQYLILFICSVVLQLQFHGLISNYLVLALFLMIRNLFTPKDLLPFRPSCHPG